MTRILITGATGNVGMEVIKSLSGINANAEIIAGVRNNKKYPAELTGKQIRFTEFDFEKPETQQRALSGCDLLFLLRPPQIADVKKYFYPLIDIIKNSPVKHIVFLSVQGVEKNGLIPHHKIEQLIAESKISYTFLRPAYFMQNFTTTLRKDLVEKRRLFLPAGNAKFTLVDVADIGRVAAVILSGYQHHVNKAYDLTCNEKYTFKELSDELTTGLGMKIQYLSPNLLRFYRVKRKEGLPGGFIGIMILLHFLPRFQKEPAISQSIPLITGKPATTFREFIELNKQRLTL